jgi:hypothetical protein
MAEPVRISLEDTRKKLESGDALLVCAYTSDERFKKNHLEGAISFNEFMSMKPSLPKDKEIIFYCA